jgi:predicted nucleic-acid-binding Zn-ribbon protein
MTEIICNFDNHPNCPKCGSSNTILRKYTLPHQKDYINRPQQAPVCKDCYYTGLMAFESISWACMIVNGIFCNTKEDRQKAIELINAQK